jgi:hypothetical protein
MGVVTVMSTVPADPAGDTAVTELAESTVKLAAGVAPKETAVAPNRSAPVMNTDDPPVVVPEAGLIDEMLGADDS